MKRDVFLLAAYNAVTTAVSGMDRAVVEGGKPEVIVFRPTLHRFLEPLEGQGVKLFEFPQGIPVNLYRPWRWPVYRSRIRAWREGMLDHIRGCRVHFYSKGYDVGCMGLLGHLASDNELIFTNLEADDASGVYGAACQDGTSHCLGWLATWISGAPIHYCRPHSPIPVLRPEFFEKFQIRILSRESLEAAMEGPCRRALTVTSEAEVLWLYDEDLDCVGWGGVSADVYRESLSKVRAKVDIHFPRRVQQFKSHPASPRSDGTFFSGLAEIPSHLPLEFVRFPRLKWVIGMPSYAMRFFSTRKGVRVASILPQVPMTENLSGHYQKLLQRWIDPEGNIVPIENLESFARMCSHAS